MVEDKIEEVSMGKTMTTENKHYKGDKLLKG